MGGETLGRGESGSGRVDASVNFTVCSCACLEESKLQPLCGWKARLCACVRICVPSVKCHNPFVFAVQEAKALQAAGGGGCWLPILVSLSLLHPQWCAEDQQIQAGFGPPRRPWWVGARPGASSLFLCRATCGRGAVCAACRLGLWGARG